MSSNTDIYYEVSNTNQYYVERDTANTDPALEFPSIYGNENFVFTLDFGATANTTITTTISSNTVPDAFNYVVTSVGPPLDPNANITIDLSPGTGGGYETATTNVVAYWDDFTNSDFANGIANTFNGSPGLFGTITVYNHKIRWENVEWANWSSSFNLGFFNNQNSNFWNTYNGGNLPEQIVIYPDYNGDQTVNQSYETTIANTVPYFIPPQPQPTYTTVSGAIVDITQLTGSDYQYSFSGTLSGSGTASGFPVILNQQIGGTQYYRGPQILLNQYEVLIQSNPSSNTTVIQVTNTVSTNTEVTSINIISNPSWVDVTVIDGNKIRVTKNVERIWPEEQFQFTTYANSEFIESNKSVANVDFDQALSYYAGLDPNDATLVTKWIVPEAERQGNTSIEVGTYVFEFTAGNNNPVPITTFEQTFTQDFYWSTRPGLELFESITPTLTTSNTEYTQ